jgi:hypothetical protein
MKQVRKSIKSYVVKVLDAKKEGVVLDTFEQSFKPRTEKVAVDFIKKTGKTAIEVEVTEKIEVRAMPFDFFMANSTVVENAPIETETEPTI